MSRDRRSQTRPVSQAESIQHVRKAQQYLASAAAALQSEAFDACARNAVLHPARAASLRTQRVMSAISATSTASPATVIQMPYSS